MRLALTSGSIGAFVLLTACGGGGDPAPVPTNEFTGFSGVPLNGAYAVDGVLISRSLSTGPGGTTMSAGLVDDNVASVLTVTNEGGDVVALRLLGGTIDATVDTTPTVNPGILTFVDGDIQIIAADPATFGNEYSTFGLGFVGSPTGKVFSGVFGLKTDGAGVPVAPASYDGASVGFFVDGSGTPYLSSSTIGATTDFSNVTVTSSGTQTVGLEPGDTLTSTPALDFVATATVTGATFDGSYSGTGLSGDFAGRFFGPAAEEMGGTFSFSGTTGDYIGAFGAN